MACPLGAYGRPLKNKTDKASSQRRKRKLN